MDCLSHIKAEAPKGRSLADLMYGFFEPILSEKAGEKGRGELKAQIYELCREAYDLRMMMRKSKARYTCEFPPTPSIQCFLEDYAQLAEPISVEGGRNKDGSDEIAYTVFGGLIKYTETGKRTLERAQVIMKPNSR